MQDYVTPGRFIPSNSFIHRLDSRTKLFLAIVLVMMIFNTVALGALLLIGFFTGLAFVSARIKLSMIFKLFKPFFWIVILTMILQFFIVPGEILIKVWFFTISREGIISGLILSYRLALAIMITTLLTISTSPLDMTGGLEKVFNPLRRIGIPVSEISLMITVTVRFIPTLLEEADKIIKAQASRGAEFDSGNYYNRAKNMVGILVPMIVNSISRADDLAIAMESRGFSSGSPRTRMNPLKFGKQDILAVFSFAVLLLAIKLFWY